MTIIERKHFLEEYAKVLLFEGNKLHKLDLKHGNLRVFISKDFTQAYVYYKDIQGHLTFFIDNEDEREAFEYLMQQLRF
jgi:hypothetical protein